MGNFTHDRASIAYTPASTKQEASGSRLENKKERILLRDRAPKRYSTTEPTADEQTTVVSPNLFPGGLWLELFNAGPMQLLQAIIFRAGSKENVAQKNFALPEGESSFFWSLDTAAWTNDTYVLLIRGEKHLLQLKIT